MTNSKHPILVFGATGRQGGSVAKALLKAGWPVRALVPDSTKAASLQLRNSGVELVQGSFEETKVVRTAMKDAYGVFSVLPASLAAEDEVRHGISIADIAAETGVNHFVYSSGASVGNELTGVPRFDAKPRIEAHIRQLDMTTTIIRPMIFMEMLVRPGFGLDEGRLVSLIRSDHSIQLTAVEDIGRFVAAVLADKSRFGGATLKIASDRLTGRELAVILSEAIGRPIAYERFPEDVLAANADLAHMAESLEDGPLAEQVDLELMREINPDLLTFRSWLARSGRRSLDAALSVSAS
ncbi:MULTISPECIES: NmrA/HSCARG family protein [Hyphomicrobiales]|uniref:NmrA/HSCARG family protein n=1 Tax=Agrobacterium pusense TaxID=648995 RepID=A0AA44IXS1_9HYPH|nr:MULTISPECIES: NmrA/HSCARG family protein [Hyphomicrobiales]KAB2697764.1 NmrA/HSCARG family protein [Ochrobactrum sp. Kaboul]MBO9196015.1 NmrA/HSCARG family protein [Rhizobium sp. 16-449-1b]HCJ71218.1 NmrA/HSCARG family protein [Agrobacterium sp.]EXL01442.1 NmrA family protein [Brucella anthropi]MDH0616134.1 NmrA/HSCARG family protein [Agrobacterium sp. GD03872]